MARSLDKFLLLMWKNWTIQRRHIKQTIIEILAPVFFCALLVVIRSLIKIEDKELKTFEPFGIDNYSTFGNWSLPVIAFSPISLLINSTMKRVIPKFEYPDIKLVGLENSEQLERYLTKESNMIFTLCGVQFDDSLIGKDEFPEDIKVTFRFPAQSRYGSSGSSTQANWMTNILFPLYQVPGPKDEDSNEGSSPPGYYQEHFIAIQHQVSLSIIEQLKSIQNTDDSISAPEVMLQRFPYPAYIDDPLLQGLSSFISLVIMLSFIYTAINTVKVITNEKEKQVKEVMKIMGLPNWLHWTAWFMKTFMFVLISCILITILVKVPWLPGEDVSVFTNSDATVIFVFLCVYMCTTITFCFMLSSFFSKANTAATIAGLFWFLSYAPYMFLQSKYDTLTLSTKLALCLGSNSAMAFGFQFMLMFEGTSEGLQWNSVWESVTPDDTFVLGHVILMLIADAFIYLLITLYIEAILPGEYGIPLPWYFPFTKSFWCGKTYISNTSEESTVQADYSEIMEKEPSHLVAGIQIKALKKVFKKKVAVRGLNLNMYEDQITALLGHNGAGKTTTMSMLTGIYPPTNGTAIIGGYDICYDMPKIRASLGLCPQHNVLFDDLTVKEHLYFFGKLKGLSKHEIEQETQKYIQLLELVPKTNAKAGTLSGGMKRKLSVGIALCGNSKIVMLDEPTAGMDPAARRAIWDILQAEKKGRTMLLTTHFMDEADLLGDRIAIMAGGMLQCCGSSFFLKKKYGAGYQLTLEKSSSCVVTKITELLGKYIPSIQVDSNVGSELTYRLSEDQLYVFENMLRDLENNASNLGVLNYGISLTTLEEVFMSVGADHGQEEEQNELEMNGVNRKNENGVNTTNGGVDFERQYYSETTLNVGTSLLSGWPLLKNQIRAMILKKYYSTLRAWGLTLIQLFLPVIFLIIAIMIGRNMASRNDLPALDFSLDSYSDPVTVADGTGVYLEEYKKYVSDEGHTIQTTENFTDYILEMSEENLPVVRTRYIAGATFLQDSITAWFNNIPLHSLPLTLNLVHNAILHKEVQKKHNIHVVNYPLPYTIDTQIQQSQDASGTGFQLAFNIGFSMAFVASFYIMFCVRERTSKAKHLQFVSGVNVFMFWISSYFFDFVHFILTSLFLIITLVSFQEDGFSTFEEIGRVFLLLILFGLSVLPLIYLASFLFRIPTSGYTIMTFFSIFTGCFGFMIVVIFQMPGLDLVEVGDGIDWVLLFIPHYGLASGIYHLHTLYASYKICDMITANGGDISFVGDICNKDISYYAWQKEGIGRNLFFSALSGIILFTLLIIIELRLPQKLIYKLQKSATPPDEQNGEDDDVAKEALKIKNMTQGEINSYSLVLKDFSKYYKKFLAVNKLSVGVKGSECFGLLGINGAGKTSTFKMLTGDENISFGDAWVNGLSLKNDMKKVHRIIGYCPQFDALLDNLTGRETLTMFSLLRGVHKSETEYLCEKLASDFNFARHIDKKVKEYSGGNKRKLSTAVALIGDPSVVYLDEPSTGMDPAAKRILWNGLCKVRDSGKCIVLTSHSMEECEALCTRLAIMVNGNFKCIGSTQHLKSKFSEGYTLTVKVRRENNSRDITNEEIQPIENYIKSNFPSAVLKEKYQELLTYYISQKSIPWSKMFGLMEKGKEFLNIEDYSLGQSSLEQVFLSFTKYQKEVDE